MARKKSDNRSADLIEAIASLLLLYLIYMGYLWVANRAEYWRQLGYVSVGSVLIAVVVIGLMRIRNARRKKKEDALLSDLHKNGFDDKIVNFIDSFGRQKMSKDRWNYGGYSFDWQQLKIFRDFLNENGMRFSTEKWNDFLFVLRHFIYGEKERFVRDSVSAATPQGLDKLSGTDFENLLVRLFKAMGYSVEPIGGHGDQGGDLVVNMGNRRVLIQAKRWIGSVGNNAVQEAVAARQYYRCDEARVVASSNFTAEAVTLAAVNHIELIGRDQVRTLLLRYLKEGWS